MPIWLYEIPPWRVALLMVVVIEVLSLVGLFVVRRFLLPSLRFNEGINDAVSGTVQAIGVFYGITVGLIAVSVWDLAFPLCWPRLLDRENCVITQFRS